MFVEVYEAGKKGRFAVAVHRPDGEVSEYIVDNVNICTDGYYDCSTLPAGLIHLMIDARAATYGEDPDTKEAWCLIWAPRRP